MSGYCCGTVERPCHNRVTPSLAMGLGRRRLSTVARHLNMGGMQPGGDLHDAVEIIEKKGYSYKNDALGAVPMLILVSLVSGPSSVGKGTVCL